MRGASQLCFCLTKVSLKQQSYGFCLILLCAIILLNCFFFLSLFYHKRNEEGVNSCWTILSGPGRDVGLLHWAALIKLGLKMESKCNKLKCF